MRIISLRRLSCFWGLCMLQQFLEYAHISSVAAVPNECLQTFVPLPLYGKQHYVIGVLANRGKDQAIAEFNQTFNEYLTQRVGPRFEPRISFSMVPVAFAEVDEYVRLGKVDLVFLNPAAFSCVDSKWGAASLATIKRQKTVQGQSHIVDMFGGLIIARQDRHDIMSVADVRGKSFAAASMTGLGSGQAQFRELFKLQISFLHDVEQAIFTSNQNDVVKLVASGAVDVGFVRENQLAKMQASGTADPADFKALDAVWRDYNGGVFPYALTTDLFPEWNVAALDSVEDTVQREISLALLEMEPGHEASAGRYHSWGPSKSYMLLRNMQDDLGYIKLDPETQRRQCMDPSSLYDSVVCPPGHFVDSKENVDAGCARAGRECPEGSQCLCKPCIRGYAIDTRPRGRMSTCEQVEQGGAATWVLTDNKKRLSTLDLEVRFHDLSAQGYGEGKRLLGHYQVVRPHRLDGFAYELQLPASAVVGMHVVEVLLEGEHTEVSPTFLEILPRDCEREYPGAQRVPNAQGECVCNNATMDVGQCISLKILPIIAAVFTLLVALSAGAYVFRRRRQARDAEEVRVEARIDELRTALWIQRKDGFRMDSEWGRLRETTVLRVRMLENLARLSLLLEFDIRQVDMLSAVLRYFGEQDQNSDDTEAKQYLALRHLLLEISKRILDPSTPDGKCNSEASDVLSWGCELSASERFEFFRLKIAKLHFWQEGQNFLFLKGVAQMFMQELRVSCDDLYTAIATEVGGQELIALTGPEDMQVCRQDHPTVCAIPVVESLGREVRLRKMTSAYNSPLPPTKRPRSNAEDRPKPTSRVSVHGDLVSWPMEEEEGNDASESPVGRSSSPDGTQMSDAQMQRLLQARLSQLQLEREAGANAKRNHAGRTGEECIRRERTLLQGADGESVVVEIEKSEGAPGLACGTALDEEAASDRDSPSPWRRGSEEESVGGVVVRKAAPQALKAWISSEAGDSFAAATSRRPSSTGSAKRGKSPDDGDRVDYLRGLHAGLKHSVRGLEKLFNPEEVMNEEAFVVHLFNRAHLLNEAFQAKVDSLFNDLFDPTALVGGSDDPMPSGSIDAPDPPAVYPGPVKTKQRMLEKVLEYSEELESRGKPIEDALPLTAMILDPIRVSIVCNSPVQVLECARWLLEHGKTHDMPVVRLKNKFAARDSTEFDGYRDIMLCVVFKGALGLNIIGEIQLLDKRMHAIKIKMHRLYKVKRATAADKI